MPPCDGNDGLDADAPPISRPAMTLLPAEVLLAILENDKLDRRDVAALRLTCRALMPAATRRLFSRIFVSKLYADFTHFVQICSSEHLAEHVMEVEWLEISHADADFHYYLYHGIHSGDEITHDLYVHFDQVADKIFWMVSQTSPQSTDEAEAQRRDAIAKFGPRFQSAIDKLPNLHTFISRPITSSRVLANLEYPLEAWNFQLFKSKSTTSSRNQRNDGLIHFLLPAMARETSTVTRLQWFDEFPGYSYLRPFPPEAFQKLESLEMSISQWREESTERNDLTVMDAAPYVFQDAQIGDLDCLKAAFDSAAPTLRHFKLNLDDATISRRFKNTHLGAHILSWLSNGNFSLQSLELSTMSLTTATLRKAIQANAKWLSHLALEDVPVRARLIRQMAQIPGLQLDSIQLFLCREWFNGDGFWPTERHQPWLDETDGAPSDLGDPSQDTLVLEGRVDLKEGKLLAYLRGDNSVQQDGERVDDMLFSPDYLLVTTMLTEEESIYSDSESETSSEDTIAYRRRTGPWWVWQWFYDELQVDPTWPAEGRLLAFQVPATERMAYPTTRWRFTSRHGEVGYGDDP